MIESGTIYDRVEEEIVRRRLHKRSDVFLDADIGRLANTPPWEDFSRGDQIGAAAVLLARAERLSP